MFGNTNVCVRSWSQFSSCPLFWPMQHRQEAGATVYSTIPAVPLDTTDSSGFHTAWGLAARPPQPLRDPQLPMLPLQCWQLIWGPKKQRGHLLPLPPSSLGLAWAELSCNQTSGGLCHFQMQPWEGGVTIKDVLDLGRVEGNCWAARKMLAAVRQMRMVCIAKHRPPELPAVTKKFLGRILLSLGTDIVLILSTAGLPPNSALIAVGFSRSELGEHCMTTAWVLAVCKPAPCPLGCFVFTALEVW